jgi:iron complex transport system ATP-binding protein
VSAGGITSSGFQPVLSVQDLVFSYGGPAILTGVSFDLERGQLLGILGANGAGKSTLFRCILGHEKNYSGSITLSGGDVKKMPAELLAKHIAYVPQSHFPSFNYSVFDMALMGTVAQTSAWTMPGKKQYAAAEEALELLGIRALSQRGFRQLSGGEQQLVLVARALAQKASILVMDEPTANLDYGNQIRVLGSVRELTRRGYSIIMSTHNPNHAFLFTDRVITLHNGKIITEGKPEEALTAETIKTLYGVNVSIRRDDNGTPSCTPVLQRS